MKRKFYTLLFVLFTFQTAVAQNQANIWYFGAYCGLDFNTGVPVVTHEIPHSSVNANAVMCDSDGAFLFSFSGKQIWNWSGQIMQNGDYIIGDRPASQGALIVQKPGSNNLYYLFTVGYDDSNDPLIGAHYSVVDMNLDGGLGAVTEMKNIPLDLAWAALEKLTAVQHANGKDIWIIVRNFKIDRYVSFLLTSSGLSAEAVLSPATERSETNNKGTMKISPDKKYLVAAYERCDCYDALKQSFDVCNFSALTGEIELLYTISRNDENSGEVNEPSAVEFSPDSKLLYVVYYNTFLGIDTMELFQYDMQYVNDSLLFKQSERFIARGTVDGLQLARDGKIYCTGYNGSPYDYISVINKPWERGTNCNYQANAIYMDGGEFWSYLPNILLDHLYRFEWEGECARNPVAFQPNFIPEPSSILWSFGDGEISTELWPVHEYENNGEYEVYVKVTYPNGRIEETSRIITIKASPYPDLGPDTLSCEGAEIVLIAGSDSGMYAWSNGSFGENVFSITVSDTGTYWVKVTNSEGCYARDTIHFGWYDKAIFNEGDMVITPTACGGSSGSIVGLQAEGTEPLSYAWYDGNGNMVSTNLDITNLSVGNYFLHVTDGNDCITISEAYTISDAGDIDKLEVEFDASYCGQNNGSVDISATSGAGTDLLFSIDNGSNWQTDNVFTNIPAGNYFVKVGDQGDCETVFENNPVVIENIPGPEITNVTTIPSTMAVAFRQTTACLPDFQQEFTLAW